MPSPISDPALPPPKQTWNLSNVLHQQDSPFLYFTFLSCHNWQNENGGCFTLPILNKLSVFVQSSTQIHRNGNFLRLLLTILPEALLVTHVTNSTFAQNQKYSRQTSNKTRNLANPVNGAATPRPRLISWLPLPWIVATIINHY